jgi:hypothetical protein
MAFEKTVGQLAKANPKEFANAAEAEVLRLREK